MKKISNLGKVLSRDEAKKIIGGDYGDGGCLLGEKSFYTSSNGCGYATNGGSDGNGGCVYYVTITEEPPCGWA